MITRAVILSTGDELTTGRVVDTNSAVIADQLSSTGVEVVAVLETGDDREKLMWALGQARDLGDLVVGTGGLGPTADDLTTEVVAQFLRTKVRPDDLVAQSLKARFEARAFPWTDNNLKQAMFPEGATIIPNPVGSAPGFRVPMGQGKTLIWLSGVPREMTAMLSATVMPWIAQQRGEAERICATTFKIQGLTESKLDDILKPVQLGSQAKLSFRINYPDLSLRLTVRGGREGEQIFAR